MAEERVQRRLAAIFAADMVEYSRLMDAAEHGVAYFLPFSDNADNIWVSTAESDMCPVKWADAVRGERNG